MHNLCLDGVTVIEKMKPCDRLREGVGGECKLRRAGCLGPASLLIDPHQMEDRGSFDRSQRLMQISE